MHWALVNTHFILDWEANPFKWYGNPLGSDEHPFHFFPNGKSWRSKPFEINGFASQTNGFPIEVNRLPRRKPMEYPFEVNGGP